jgi:ectoine hydroxylase-related dioxygenase (phytanoyl-CoA dioxygenase family)
MVGADLELQGYCFHMAFLADDILATLLAEVGQTSLKFGAGGIRNADKKFTAISNYLASQPFKTAAAQYLNDRHNLIRVILFDKTPAANWLVTWHQDKTVAVGQKQNLPGWRNWSIKDGVYHVQPPVAVLENMLTIRIHLDDTNEAIGCLKVIPRSQKLGLLSPKQIDAITHAETPVNCIMSTGDALIMRPLLLHASSKGTAPSHRRILHLEFSNYNFES